MTQRDARGRFLSAGERDGRGRFVKADIPAGLRQQGVAYSDYHRQYQNATPFDLTEVDAHIARLKARKPWYRRLNDWLRGGK
jgi:hypothetical protein